MIQTSDRNFKDSGKTTDFLAILIDEFDRQSVNNDNPDITLAACGNANNRPSLGYYMQHMQKISVRTLFPYN